MNRTWRTKHDRPARSGLRTLRVCVVLLVLILAGFALYTALALLNVFDALGWTYDGAIEQAFRRLEEADYDGAIAACDRALRRDPKRNRTRLLEGIPYMLRGEAWEGKGNLEEALRDYTTAVGYSNEGALACRGRVYEKMGKMAEATQDYCHAILAQRDSRIGVLLVAEARTWSVKDGAAVVLDMIEFFDNAIETQPVNEDLRTCRTLLLEARARLGAVPAGRESRTDQ